MTTFTFRGITVPERTKAAIDAWVKYAQPCGHFVTAVLANDLFEACARADDENLTALSATVAYIYNECPSACWGSQKHLNAWEEQILDLEAA